MGEESECGLYHMPAGKYDLQGWCTITMYSSPYGFVRNPIYVGNMLMYLGIVIIAGSQTQLL